MDHEYWTYVVASRSGTLYIGMTNNIERRMWEHKNGVFEGLLVSITATGWCTTKALTRCSTPLQGKNN